MKVIGEMAMHRLDSSQSGRMPTQGEAETFGPSRSSSRWRDRWLGRKTWGRLEKAGGEWVQER
jgi:hypothetical protein